MKSAFIFLLLFAGTAAGQQVHICKGTNGESVYQDRPCGAPISVRPPQRPRPPSPLVDAAKQGIVETPGLLTEAIGRTVLDSIERQPTEP